MTATVHALPVLEVHLSGDAGGFTAALTEATAELNSVPLAFARPPEMPALLLALAERMWNANPKLDELWLLDDVDDVLATLLGLDLDGEHDELTRCEYEGCGAWFWADEGATVLYESGRELTMCDVHAVPDDPGARVYPGYNLEIAWRERDEQRMLANIRATGRAW